ncbi:transmembrane protein 141 isoform X2 [Xenopus tropicalis]|uniref:Transmembrane protein 141 isoform X2 n=1 Tax=Xenopus tropicalis TaxID=8364 RepID=A0A8J1K254_XENTR|nr:transmembrane protein 141 isoform X2 [Xenopus tropicalis]
MGSKQKLPRIPCSKDTGRELQTGAREREMGLAEYAGCQSHAFMKGVGTFITGSGAAFVVQKALNTRLPYPLQWSILLSVVAGSVASYAITRRETQRCSDLWMYLEAADPPPAPGPVSVFQGPRCRSPQKGRGINMEMLWNKEDQ